MHRRLPLLLLLASIAVPASLAAEVDWERWRECENATGSLFTDVDEDVTEDECLMMPRWQSVGCTELTIRNFCQDEDEVSYADCLHQRANQLCCYRFRRCEQLVAEGLDCSSYDASGKDLDTCLATSSSTKDACVADCQAQFSVGPERAACKEVCREGRNAARRTCKRCHRCDVAIQYCSHDDVETTTSQ